VPVCSVTNIVCTPKDITLLQVSYCQKTYFDTVLAEEMFQFKLPTPNTISFPAGQRQNFCHIRPNVAFYTWPSLGCPSAIGYQEELVAAVGRLPTAVPRGKCYFVFVGMFQKKLPW
jgi:hypothetical protein